eukprot:maker-scaffold_69-snap-gene-0.54-mRNA-1 protein AED:0.01 eAED:0.01 QI:175/0.5/0.66/1/1/1/3/108/669
MPSYVPPHLRNQTSSQNRDQNSSYQSSSQGKNHGSKSYGSQNNRSFNSRSFSQNSNPQRSNQPSNFGQNRRGQNFSNYGSRNYNSGRPRRHVYRYHPMGGDATPPETVFYVSTEEGKSKVLEEEKKRQAGQAQPTVNSRFASWDVRAAPVSTGRTSLGFYGSTNVNQSEVQNIFGHQNATGINFDKYDDIPVESSGENIPPPVTDFASTSLPQGLQDNIKRSGFTKPTPVQKYSLPIGLANRDLMACAQTGSGKTGGFLFPIICKLLTSGAKIPNPEDKQVAFPSALVLSPTRELAQQIQAEALKFSYGTGIRPVVVYGGQDSRQQARELSHGVDLLIGTPGRLIDFLEKGYISLLCVQFLVMDEADRCILCPIRLDMGFEASIRRIVEEADLPPDRNTFMFSATFPKEIQQLAQDFMRNYIFLTVGRVGSASKDIQQRIERVQENQKRDLLVDILGQQTATSKVLIFTETKRGADNLCYYLEGLTFPCVSIHGDLDQYQREQALQLFKTSEKPILVATDVASRGLDIDRVTLVVNYDLPGNIDDYVHRIGRTGRAGNKGEAISFFNDSKNMGLAGSLLVLLKENEQQVPNWLEILGRGGNRRGRYGGNRGTRDMRSNVNRVRSNQGHGYGGRQSGGGGATSSTGYSSNRRPQSNYRSNQRNSNVKDAW